MMLKTICFDNDNGPRTMSHIQAQDADMSFL